MDNLEKAKWLDDYNKSLEGKTESELREIEETIVKEAEVVDKEVSETSFNLPTKGYKEAAAGIRLLLEKQSVQWQYTLGLVSMFDFWNPEKNPKTVVYPMLDSSLRTLGGGTFTGYAEWAAVVAVNKYFEPIREEYVKVTERVWDIAAKHNAVLEKLKLFETVGAEAATIEAAN